MNKFSILALVLFGSCIFLGSCKKQTPQLPSNKGNEIDKSGASLLKINQILASKEDCVLKKFAESKGIFKKNELGFWYKIYNSGNGSAIKDSTICKLSSKLMLLNGKILEENINQFVIGKKQMVVGLEEGLKLMHRGDSATFIIPWYLGYGMKGNKPLVAPYTSIIYKIKLLN
jgi:FKBP-type peptidyl-prolyl cis-trans isomerase